ncbi:hypothetical protein ALP14_200078 [Pseudomonas amygdali pv. myricae]|nr:hypothetical protein ALP14_200078 [Pseudomonas amygdali pv. myricae]
MQQAGVETAFPQAMFELDALGFRADQPEVSKVAALEDCSSQLKVQLMVVGHDNAVSADWQLRDLVDRLFTDDLQHALGHRLGEFVLTCVDPAHPAGQAGQQWHQRTANMTGTKHGDLCDRFAHGFEQQHIDAATALTEACAEVETFQTRLPGAAGQHLAGDLHGLVFQVPAADGVVDMLGTDHHLRAGVAWRRAQLLDDGHQNAGFSTGL